MKIVIASGKGGTGKTTIAVNLALSLGEKKVQLLDCDVEEPNAHLFLKPEFDYRIKVGIPVPSIDSSKCTFCGRCAEVCMFNALAVFQDQVMVLSELCHGCGSCTYLCPEEAITEIDRPIGIIERGNVNGLDFIHGRLNPGEAMSPPLINVVKKMISQDCITIIDAPPGTSCPVVTAAGGCDYCVLVTEPTPFGLNDLDLACKMVSKLGIPAGVLINRSDIGDRGVEDYCLKNDITVLYKIPWDLELARLYARGETAVLNLPGWKERFHDIYLRILSARKAALK